MYSSTNNYKKSNIIQRYNFGQKKLFFDNWLKLEFYAKFLPDFRDFFPPFLWYQIITDVFSWLTTVSWAIISFPVK